jgi:hypothetical protein
MPHQSEGPGSKAEGSPSSVERRVSSDVFNNALGLPCQPRVGKSSVECRVSSNVFDNDLGHARQLSPRLSTLDPRHPSSDPRPSAPALRAFSLIEIMVTVGLLTFIILGLLLMFNQTQRAFRTGMTQTDVLEAGRATMDIIARELEQMSPSQVPDIIDSGVRRRATNFFVEPSDKNFAVVSPYAFSWKDPLIQDLPGQDFPGNYIPRTNLLQRFFFLSKFNQDWIGTGYEVLPDDANQLVGTLYRYSVTNTPRWTNLYHLVGSFSSTPVTNLSRIADGVVHLRLRAFARNGYLVTTNLFSSTNASYPTRVNGPYTNVANAVAYNSVAYSSGGDYYQAACYFMSNAVPGYLELELGILEPRVLSKYRSIDAPETARAYLSNHVANVHIFRQRIPVRNVDLSAYP